MSLKIRLYQECKLTNNYTQVFKNRATLDTYLGGLTYTEIYSGDDIYYTNSGTLSIDNANLTGHTGDKYNYMLFRSSDSNGYIIDRYAFINNITIVNEVAVIEYEEDIWHSYAITSGTHKIKLFNSLLDQAKTLNGGTGYEYSASQIASLPKGLPIQPEGQNAPSFKEFTASDPAEVSCYILITASVFKLTAQDKVNERYVSNYLLSYKENATGGVNPALSTKTYLWNLDDSQTLEILASIQAKASDTTVSYKTQPNYHYDIIDVKLIPEIIGSAWFEDYLTGDSSHDAGLHPDFSLTLNMYDLDSSQTSYHDFDTEIAFNNLVLSSEYKYISGGSLRYTYNGIDSDTVLSYTKTIASDKEYVAVGNLSRIIPITYNGLSKTAKIELSVNLYNNSMRLLLDNTITDISSDFTLQIPISYQGADITEQQKIALRTGNAVAMIGMVGQAVQTGISMGSSFVGGLKGIGAANTMQGAELAAGQAGLNIGGSAVSGILGLISSGIQLDARNSAQYIKNKAIAVNDTTVMNCVLNGLREIKMNYDNSILLEDVISKYGYKYRLICNSFDTVYSANNYVKFTQANVYGEFSQSVANSIARILENGTILL